MIGEKAAEIATTYADEKVPSEEWNIKGLREAVFKQFNFQLDVGDETLEGEDPDGLAETITKRALEVYETREKAIGVEQCRELERIVMLQTVDHLWKDHLLSMDHLKEGIGLRGYAQQDPLLVYKKEGFGMFVRHDFPGQGRDAWNPVSYWRDPAPTGKSFGARKSPRNRCLFSPGGDEGDRKEPVRRKIRKR